MEISKLATLIILKYEYVLLFVNCLGRLMLLEARYKKNVVDTSWLNNPPIFCYRSMSVGSW